MWFVCIETSIEASYHLGRNSSPTYQLLSGDTLQSLEDVTTQDLQHVNIVENYEHKRNDNVSKSINFTTMHAKTNNVEMKDSIKLTIPLG